MNSPNFKGNTLVQVGYKRTSNEFIHKTSHVAIPRETVQEFRDKGFDEIYCYCCITTSWFNLTIPLNNQVFQSTPLEDEYVPKEVRMYLLLLGV